MCLIAGKRNGVDCEGTRYAPRRVFVVADLCSVSSLAPAALADTSKMTTYYSITAVLCLRSLVLKWLTFVARFFSRQY